MVIAASVILFHPDTKTIDNISSYSSFVNTLYVLDNTENPSTEIVEKLKEFPNCRYIHNGINEGIAKRLNEACDIAIEDGFKWLLTMDQDSSFSKSSISTYLSCVEQLDNKNETALTGVEIIKENVGDIGCKSSEVTSLITSGSVLNLRLFKKIGNFDDALFIDQVDIEYCYRAISKGYKVLKFDNIILEHSLGVSSIHRSLKSFKNTSRSLHSPVRIYYLTRNYLYMRSRYRKTFREEILKTRKDLLIRLKNNLLYGKQKIAVIRYFFKGIVDFKRKKMGKISF